MSFSPLDRGSACIPTLPKVLHPLAGKALVSHVIDTARSLQPKKLCLVYGHGGDVVRSTLESPDLSWALQEPQLGTGHAVQQALPYLGATGVTLVLYGDVPLIQAETLKRLLHVAQDALAILTVELTDPVGYGRIVRNAAGAGSGNRRAQGCDNRRAIHPRDQYRHHGDADCPSWEMAGSLVQ